MALRRPAGKVQEREAPVALMPEPVPEQQELPELKKPRIAVLVVSHNRAEVLRRCLESIERADNREEIHLVVVDNGSRDGSASLETDFPAAQFIRMPRNFGLTKALNVGIRATQTEYIFFLHEDTELPPQAAREMAAILDAREELAAVCPQFVEGPPSFEPGTEPVEIPEVSGAAFLMRAFFIGPMRQIDERYGQHGSDRELSYQIRRAGKKIARLPGVHVRHEPRGGDSALLRADQAIADAVYIAKRSGFLAGLKARIGAAVGALVTLRLREFGYLAAGQKIDGSQGE